MKAHHIKSQIIESKKEYIYIPEKGLLLAYCQKDGYSMKMDYSSVDNYKYLNNADLFIKGKVPGIIPGIKDSAKEIDIAETTALQMDRNKRNSLMNGHHVSTIEDLINVFLEERKKSVNNW